MIILEILTNTALIGNDFLVSLQGWKEFSPGQAHYSSELYFLEYIFFEKNVIFVDLINREYIEEYLSSLVNYTETPIMKEMRSIANDKAYPIIRPEVAALLNIIIRIKQPQSILEIGTSIGYSGLLMLQSMGSEGHLTTVENQDELIRTARSNFEKQKVLQQVTLLQGDGGEILHYLENKFDIIFLDGPKAQYLLYLPDCLRLLKQEGLLICDDVLFYGMVAKKELLQKRKITIVKRMKKFLRIISDHPLLDTTILPIGDGISISVKRGE